MTGLPATATAPFMGIDFSNALAQDDVQSLPLKVLLIGQRLSTGTVAEAVPYLAYSADQVATKSGTGSMLHRMAIAHFKNNKFVPVTCIGLDDAVGTQATHVFTITGPATARGTFACKIAGTTYAVPVVVDDTATTIADALVALITADLNIQVTAANTAGEVTLTNRNDGVIAGDLDTRFISEEFPAGVGVGTVVTTAGTVDPDIADALAVVGDEWYNIIVNPYTDDSVTTNVTTLEEWLDDQNDILEMKDAVAYQVVRDTHANLITYGAAAGRNSQFLCTGMGYKRTASTYEVAAAVAGAVATSINDYAATPLHRMALKGIEALEKEDQWDYNLRNQLARGGIFTLSDERGVQTDAMVTMYLENEAGAADTSYQQQNRMFQLMKARYTFRNWILGRYARAMLADNADNIPAGRQVLTPEIAKDEAIAWFRAYQGELFEGGDDAVSEFAAAVTTTRVGDNRMDWVLPPDMMDQFIVGSGTIAFK